MLAEPVFPSLSYFTHFRTVVFVCLFACLLGDGGVWATPGRARGLFLVLHSGDTHDSAQRTL